MKFQSFATRLLLSVLVLAFQCVLTPNLVAQNVQGIHGEDHAAMATSSELVKAVRESTAKYKDVATAEADGYSLLFGCVSGPDSGAMGLHYVNLTLVAAGTVDAAHPQIVIYEPMPNGRLQLIGADFLIIASDWDKAHPGQGAPQLMGQLFQYFESPNRFGLPAFYTLHVWAWKENPNGAFVNWHPHVSCQAFGNHP